MLFRSLDRLRENAARFRGGMEANGFVVPPGEHPIVPIMLGDAVLAQSMAEQLLARGIYVIGFSFPVVPRGISEGPRVGKDCRSLRSPCHSKHNLSFFRSATLP
mgnify:CR=1 FL=1